MRGQRNSKHNRADLRRYSRVLVSCAPHPASHTAEAYPCTPAGAIKASFSNKILVGLAFVESETFNASVTSTAPPINTAAGLVLPLPSLTTSHGPRHPLGELRRVYPSRRLHDHKRGRIICGRNHGRGPRGVGKARGGNASAREDRMTGTGATRGLLARGVWGTLHGWHLARRDRGMHVYR